MKGKVIRSVPLFVYSCIFIPGHEPLATKTNLTNAVRILDTTIVRAGINAGKSITTTGTRRACRTILPGDRVGQTTDPILPCFTKHSEWRKIH
jgi:hypothetical protein